MKNEYMIKKKFTCPVELIIHFDDGNVSEGFYLRVFILLKYNVCKVEGSE